MNVKMIAIVGAVAGLGLLGLGTQSAKASGVSFNVSFPVPAFLPPVPVIVRPAPQVVVYQTPVQQQVVYQQPVCQPAPQVIYQAAPQVVYQTCPAPVVYQPQVIYAPAPVYFRPEGRFDRDDFRHDDRGRVEVRYGDRR